VFSASLAGFLNKNDIGNRKRQHQDDREDFLVADPL
jgi:hypothetical protein